MTTIGHPTTSSITIQLIGEVRRSGSTRISRRKKQRENAKTTRRSCEGVSSSERMQMNKQRVLTREDIAHRLARIAGHANSLKRLWEEERNYRDMLIQIAAVRAGLDQVARAILEQHLQQSISEAVSQADAEIAFRELKDALDRLIT